MNLIEQERHWLRISSVWMAKRPDIWSEFEDAPQPVVNNLLLTIGQMIDALEKADDSLKYVDDVQPGFVGYGVRAECREAIRQALSDPE